MSKKFLYGEEARKKMMAGIDTAAKFVVATLGPKSRNIALEKEWGSPLIVHDGVTIAKEIDLEDPFENMGAQLVKQAASNTNDAAGDGTTTSTLLAQVITQAGMKAVNSGANPMVIIRGIETAVDLVVKELERVAKPIKSKEEITNIAVVSSGNKEIGTIIANAIDKVGHDGIVTVEEGKGFDIEVEFKEGMEFDKGYASPYFATDMEKMESEIDDCYILVTDKRVNNLAELLPFLQNTSVHTKHLMVIAPEVEGEALATLVVNKLKGVMSLLAVKAPGYGDNVKNILEDIATITGATVISEDTGRTLETVDFEELGHASKVWADKDKFRLIGGSAKKGKIKEKISNLKKLIATAKSDFDRERFEERLAKFTGGVAQINVGAATEVEMNEKKERVKDAVGATRAAIEEGVLPGGAVALIKARMVLEEHLKAGMLNDEVIGIGIVYSSLEQPLRWLVKNAGEDDGYVLKEIEKSKDRDYGYNVMTGEFGSMIKLGILDPLKVTKSALKYGASVARMVLTTEGLVVNIPEEKDENQPPKF